MSLSGLSVLSTLWLAAVEAPITSVTVYGDQARVVRTAHVTLAGPQRVELPPLYGPVDLSSLRVEARGAEVVRVDLGSSSTGGPPAAETHRLVHELQGLGDQLSRVRAEREVYVTQLAALDRVRPEAPSEAPEASDAAPSGGTGRVSRVDASGWRAVEDFVGETSARLQARRRELTGREQQLARTLTRRQQEAQRLGRPAVREGHSVIVVLSGQGAATLTLTYLTSSASWSPLYEVRLEPESNQVRVTLAGRVRQTTGEDWEGTQLTLSTARPWSFEPVPRLSTWKLGQRERFIPTPTPLTDAWREPPPAAEPAPEEPDEDARMREQLLALANDESVPETPGPEARAVQDPDHLAVLIGRVVDADTKKPLSAVRVTVISPSLGSSRSVETDSQGGYRIAPLAPGVYSVRFEAGAHRTFTRPEVQLRADRTIRVNAELLPEGSPENQREVARAPTVDVGSSATGINVDQDFIRRLEVQRPGARGGASRNARAFESLAELAPGATSDAVEEVPVGLAPPKGWSPPEVDPQQPAALAGGQVLSFPAQRHETVRSSESERRIPLFTETWPVKLERELYPALTPNAFLVAQLRSPSARVLPGGEAQLFVGADPSGQARLARVSPGEPFTLPLGVDPAVRPVRNVQLVTSERGFIGKDEVTEYRVVVELANPYPRPIEVRVHDQWPLSRDGHVEVKLLSTEPYAEQDADKGTLLWRLSIPAASKQTVTFRYSVRHPKGWRLQQLP